MTAKWNTISRKQSDSQITFLGGALFADQQNCPRSVPLCHCISLSLPLRHSVCSNEWQSGDVVLIYCMVAQMEPGWNVSVIGASLRYKHLWCLGTTNCSIRNGFPPEPSAHLTHTHAYTQEFVQIHNGMHEHSKQNVHSASTKLHSHSHKLACNQMEPHIQYARGVVVYLQIYNLRQ